MESTVEKKLSLKFQLKSVVQRARWAGKNFSCNIKRVPVIFGITEFRCNNFTEKLSAVRLTPAQPRHHSFFYVPISFCIRTMLYSLMYFFYARSRSYVAHVFFAFYRRNSIIVKTLSCDLAISYAFLSRMLFWRIKQIFRFKGNSAFNNFYHVSREQNCFVVNYTLLYYSNILRRYLFFIKKARNLFVL